MQRAPCFFSPSRQHESLLAPSMKKPVRQPGKKVSAKLELASRQGEKIHPPIIRKNPVIDNYFGDNKILGRYDIAFSGTRQGKISNSDKRFWQKYDLILQKMQQMIAQSAACVLGLTVCLLFNGPHNLQMDSPYRSLYGA